MYAPPPDPLRGVRGRRLASYALDVFFLAAPWAAVGGMAVAPSGGNWQSGLAAFAGMVIFCSLASLTILVLELVVFVAKGRTLGMAVTGLRAVRGVKWLALVLDPLLATMSLGCAFPLGYVLVGTDTISDSLSTALLPIVPFFVLALNLAFLLLPPRRTLTDLMCGLRVVRDDGPASPSPPAPRGAAYTVDAFLVAACGAPVLSIVGGSQLVTAAVASALVLGGVGCVELVLRATTGATLGMRVLGLRGS